MPVGASREIGDTPCRCACVLWATSLLCAPTLLSSGWTLIPTATPAHRPTNLPSCRRRVCRDEECERPLVDNRGPSIGLREIRRLPQAAANNPGVSVSQFRWQSL